MLNKSFERSPDSSSGTQISENNAEILKDDFQKLEILLHAADDLQTDIINDSMYTGEGDEQYVNNEAYYLKLSNIKTKNKDILEKVGIEINPSLIDNPSKSTITGVYFSLVNEKNFVSFLKRISPKDVIGSVLRVAVLSGILKDFIDTKGDKYDLGSVGCNDQMLDLLNGSKDIITEYKRMYNNDYSYLEPVERFEEFTEAIRNNYIKEYISANSLKLLITNYQESYFQTRIQETIQNPSKYEQEVRYRFSAIEKLIENPEFKRDYFAQIQENFLNQIALDEEDWTISGTTYIPQYGQVLDIIHKARIKERTML